MMTSMMCSTMTRVMPERWMSRTRSMASCTSRWVRPAIASSSSRTLGSVASARAISSRLRPGVPKDRAGASASLPMPTRSSTARARISASDLREVRRNAPIITFSSTDMPSNVCGTWKVRASPSSARASGARLVMSQPSKRTFPDVDNRSPVRQLKKVDFPAPFGPIRPRMSPCSSVTEAASTALKLPNALVTSRASRSMRGSPRPFGIRHPAVSFRPYPGDQRQDAARLEPRNQHDDGAVEDKRQAGAAERGHDQNLHRDQEAEPGLRIDKSKHRRVERAGDAGQAGAQHKGIELGAACGSAQRARRALGIADGAKVKSHPAVGHPPGDAKRHRQNSQKKIVVRKRRNERQIEDVARHRRTAQSNRRAEIIGVGDNQPDEFGHRDRGHAEIVAR